MTDLPVWIGVVVAGLVGVGGWIAAGIANGRAKKANALATSANKLAEQANEIATSAVAEAKSANRISKGANKLSEEANSIAKSQALQQNEDWFVKWKGSWDKDLAMLTFKNEGRDPAREVSCIVVGGDIHEIGRPGEDVAPGKVFRMHLPQITEQRDAQAIHDRQTNREMGAAGIIWVPRQFKSTVEVTIIWKTGLGATQEQSLTKTLT